MKVLLIIVGILVVIVGGGLGLLSISLDQSPFGTLIRAHEAACKHDITKLSKELNIDGLSVSISEIAIMMLKSELQTNASQYSVFQSEQFDQLVEQQRDKIKSEIKTQLLQGAKSFNGQSCKKLNDIYFGALAANVLLRDGTYKELTVKKIESGPNNINYRIISSAPASRGTITIRFVRGSDNWTLTSLDLDQTMFDSMVKSNTIKIPQIPVH